MHLSLVNQIAVIYLREKMTNMVNNVDNAVYLIFPTFDVIYQKCNQNITYEYYLSSDSCYI